MTIDSYLQNHTAARHTLWRMRSVKPPRLKMSFLLQSIESVLEIGQLKYKHDKTPGGHELTEAWDEWQAKKMELEKAEEDLKKADAQAKAEWNKWWGDNPRHNWLL